MQRTKALIQSWRMLPKSSSLRMGRRLNARSLVLHSRWLQCRHRSIRNQHSLLARRRESCHWSRDPLCDRCHQIVGTRRLDSRFVRQRTRNTCSYPVQPGKGEGVTVRNLRMILIWTTLLWALLSHRTLLRLVREGSQMRTTPSQQSCDVVSFRVDGPTCCLLHRDGLQLSHSICRGRTAVEIRVVTSYFEVKYHFQSALTRVTTCRVLVFASCEAFDYTQSYLLQRSPPLISSVLLPASEISLLPGCT